MARNGGHRRGRGGALLAILIVAATIVPATAASAAAPSRCSPGATRCNVEYVAGGARRHQTLDVFDARNRPTGLRPAVVLVHPGGWWGGQKADMAEAARRAAQRGWVAFTIDYRLADDPAVPGPGDTTRPDLDQPRDVTTAVQWVRLHAPSFRVDPNRVALVGASAGAQLALLHALRPGSGVRAVASWAGPTDLMALGVEHPCVFVPGSGCAPVEPLNVAEMLRRFGGGCPVAQCIGRYQSTSPMNVASAGSAPALLVRATFDTTIPQDHADRLFGKLRSLGRTVQVADCTVTGTGGRPEPCDHFSLGRGAWPVTEAFLARYLGG